MNKDIKKLRSEARALSPIMSVGKDGITEGVIVQIEKELKTKRLIKIQIRASACGDDSPKKQREKLIAEIADRTKSTVVDSVGHMAVLYR